MRRDGSNAKGARGGRLDPVTAFVRGVIAWPFFIVGGALMWAAFTISGESIT